MKHRSAYWRSTLVIAVVLTLALHSLIPAGYMPDFSGYGFLTYCDGSDHMDHEHMSHMHAGHMHGSHGHGGVCPFSGGAVYGLATMDAPVIIAPVYALATEAHFFASAFTQRERFSRSSPRSPPAFS